MYLCLFMKITNILISNFRNIKASRLITSSNINIIYGDNGCGKTSLLEAISYLSICRSFRGTNANYLIQNKEQEFVLNASIEENLDDLLIKSNLGIVRNRSQDNIVSINGKKTNRLTELIDKICTQAIYPECVDLIIQGPDFRRKFLDWGLYYQYSDFKNLYAQYRKVLKQRNSLLKSNVSNDQIFMWDELLAALSIKINYYREQYLVVFLKELQDILSSFLPGLNFNFSLSKGYPKDAKLIDLLRENLEKDKCLGYTLYGCHRADLKIKVNNLNAAATLSRGQLKLLVCAMRIVQGRILFLSTKRKCIYLIDDINSELDYYSQARLLENIESIDHQVFITNINKDIKFNFNSKVNYFTIKDGIIINNI